MKTFETERLELRPLEQDDFLDVLDILGDSETAWWADMPLLDDPEEVQDFICWGNYAEGIDQYGLFEKGKDTVIGLLQKKLPDYTGKDNTVELGYIMSKDYRRKGYMTEAVRAVCADIFADPSIQEVTLEILPDNLGSRGVALACGFEHEQRPDDLRDRRYLDDQLLDHFVLRRPAPAEASRAA